MNYEFLLAIDPSGSYHEGKGTTGWCTFNCKDNAVSIADGIHAQGFDSMTGYWDAHLQLIARFNSKYKHKLCVVMEDYVLYQHKAASQINSHMETSKLIGVLQHYCWEHEIPYAMQLASEVKNRWADEILHHNRYIVLQGNHYVLPNNTKTRLDKHCRDAIRHAVHFANFKNKGDKNARKQDIRIP
jgi:hypothetical protein